MKPNCHSVKFVDTIFPVYKKNKSGRRNTTSFLSTEDLLKWSNKQSIDLGVGDILYPNCLLFMMD